MPENISYESFTIFLLAAILIIGLFNIILAGRRSSLEIITQHRVNLIDTFRKETVYIVTWSLVLIGRDERNKKLEELRKALMSLTLHLNVGNRFDYKITSICTKIYNDAYYCINHDISDEYFESNFNALLSDQSELHTNMQVYLKKEWLRVKCENMTIKLPFRYYWVPFKGFDEDWAVDSIIKNIKNVKNNKKFKKEGLNIFETKF